MFSKSYYYNSWTRRAMCGINTTAVGLYGTHTANNSSDDALLLADLYPLSLVLVPVYTRILLPNPNLTDYALELLTA